MTSIVWRKTSPLPPLQVAVDHYGLQCAIIGQNVFLVRWEWAVGCDPVFIYNIARGSWNIHSWSPIHFAALTTYHSQLVLIGGQEKSTRRVTNTVLVWQEGEWHPSLPPMTVARCNASAVNSGDLIIVAGGLVISPQSLT